MLRPSLALSLAVLALGCGSGPSIERFNASATHVPLGTNVLLSWEVKGAEQLEISEVGPVQGAVGNTTVRPPRTTTYVLRATGHGVTRESSPITVEIGAGVDARLSAYQTGSFVGTVVLARVRNEAGDPPTTDTAIEVRFPSGDGAPLTLTCAAGANGCYALYPEVAPATGSYTVSAVVEGVPRASRSTFDLAGLVIPAVTASRTGAQTVQASWPAVEDAVAYRVVVRDLGSRADLGLPVITGATSVTLSSPLLQDGTDYAVLVEAFGFDPQSPSPPDRLSPTPVSRGAAYLTSPQTLWWLYTPADYAGDTLTVTFPAMTAGERLAVLTLNLSKNDRAPTELAVTNILAPPVALAGAAEPPREKIRDTLHTWARQQEAEVIRQLPRYRALVPKGRGALLAPPGPAPASASFCVRSLDASLPSRRTATLKRETPHAALYVDNEDLADYVPYEEPAVSSGASIWTQLGDFWESTIYPVDTQTFGAESDVDANGRLIILFSNRLGPPQGGAILLGYYYAGDVVFPKDTSGNCSDGGGNRGDLFYMNGIANLLSGDTPPTQDQIDEVIQGTYPDTLAHEFQHLINFNEHHLLNGTSSDTGEDTWINEGLSVTAEDLAGFGWNRQRGRQVAAIYMNRNDDPVLRYSKASLTLWEANPVGNYEGVHTYFRFWADQRSTLVLGDLVKNRYVGIGHLEAVLGIPFEWAFATWTTGLMFSNEVFSPGARFNYVGPAWTPLHQKIASYDQNGTLTRQGYLRYAPLGPDGATANVRINGYNAFLTGPPALPGMPVTLTVSPHSARPHVVVVRFTGDLPAGIPVP